MGAEGPHGRYAAIYSHIGDAVAPPTRPSGGLYEFYHKHNLNNMPQLVPFYFLNLLTFGIIAITFLLYFVSTILLPNILRLLIARIIIVKL